MNENQVDSSHFITGDRTRVNLTALALFSAAEKKRKSSIKNRELRLTREKDDLVLEGISRRSGTVVALRLHCWRSVVFDVVGCYWLEKQVFTEKDYYGPAGASRAELVLPLRVEVEFLFLKSGEGYTGGASEGSLP